MKKMTVMVSGASGIIGYGILKSLRASKEPMHLIGTTIHEFSAAPAFCDTFVKAIRVSEENYLSWLVETLKKYQVDLFIPSFEDDVLFCSNNREELASLGVKVVLNDARLIQLCRDKWSFYEVLKAKQFPNGIATSLSDDYLQLKIKFGVPFILKPRCGSESKGFVKIYKEYDFKKYRAQMGSELMAQPLVGSDDEEYTTSVFGDGSGGYTASITMKRRLSKLGYTEKAEVVEGDALDDVLKRLCRYFSPMGPTNFQFRRANGNFHLLEINPRFSSATSIRTAFGYNEATMAIAYFLHGRLPTQPKIRQGKAVRYIDEHIFYH